MAIKTGTSGNNASIQGTKGADFIYGLGGNDTLLGNNGADLLSGGAGNDKLDGGAGADTLSGGSGSDVFFYSNYKDANGDSIVDFSAGDTIDFSKLPHHFIGNQTFTGVAGEIRYGYQQGYFKGAIPFSATVEKTTLEIDSNGDGEADVTLTVDGQINFTESTAHSGKLIFAQGVSKTGTAKGDKMSGGSGNDILSGLKGNDTIVGGEGNDRLIGGDGADTLDGGFGLDTLTGGAGNDIFRFSNTDSSYESITDFSAGDQIFVNIQNFSYIGDKEFSGTPGEYRFSQGTDSFNQSRIEFDTNGDSEVDSAILLGGAFNNGLQETKAGSNHLQIVSNKLLNGTAGANVLTGGNGNDTLNGQAGNDKLIGGIGNDTLIGGSGNDNLNGGSGNDNLNGGDGADTLLGGQGIDRLTGGAGNDVFKFTSLSDVQSPSRVATTFGYNDTITDFANGDKIDLSGIDANVNQTGDQKFTFINTNNFSGTPGELRYDSVNHFLQGDVNGDTQFDFNIEVTGVASLSNGSFTL